MLGWAGIGQSKFFSWRSRVGQPNQHHGQVPRTHWLDEQERAAIVSFAGANRGEGYRRLSYRMLDEGVAAASPATVHRVLREAGLSKPVERVTGRRGRGFEQPAQPHEHWHVDISYLNICGTFYYLCSVLDGCSRSIVQWEIQETMRAEQVELILQRAREQFPQAQPRVISDNGPQFIARDFQQFVRACGMTHVRTAPFYPQSNGKIERWHKTLKADCIRVRSPLSLADARRVVGQFVEYYNTQRLHSSLGYITPQARLEGRQDEIKAERREKLQVARAQRQERRRLACASSTQTPVAAAPGGPSVTLEPTIATT